MTDLIPTHTPTPAQDYQAATAYLASLKSAVGRRGMLSQLRKVARILGAPDIDAVNWATLNGERARHTLGAEHAESRAGQHRNRAERAEGRGARLLGARHAGYRDLSAHPQHSPASRQPTTGWPRH